MKSYYPPLIWPDSSSCYSILTNYQRSIKSNSKLYLKEQVSRLLPLLLPQLGPKPLRHRGWGLLRQDVGCTWGFWKLRHDVQEVRRVHVLFPEDGWLLLVGQFGRGHHSELWPPPPATRHPDRGVRVESELDCMATVRSRTKLCVGSGVESLYLFKYVQQSQKDQGSLQKITKLCFRPFYILAQISWIVQFFQSILPF